MSEKNSWFSTGVGEVKKAREEMASQYRPEFWLKDGESAKLIILDREPFNIMLHQLKLRGKYKKFTCAKKGCPLCKVDEPRFVSIYRVIDTRTYTDGQKKEHKNVERYWEIGTKVMTQVESLEEDDNFFGKVIKVKRVGSGPKTSYAVTLVGSPKRRPKATLKPIADYKPKSLQELQTLAELLGAKDDDDDGDLVGGSEKATSRYYEENDEEESRPPRRQRKAQEADNDLLGGDDDDDDSDDDIEPLDDDEENDLI